MTNIRRYFQPGQTCFLTHVTFDRQPLLVTHFDLLWRSIDIHRQRTPFDLIAWVVMPDHMHLVIDAGEQDVSRLMRRVKLSFSASLRQRLGRKEGRIWQYRFWDRIVRNQDELNRHIDYIHYNPVKHGHSADPFVWRYSSLQAYFEAGMYQRDWGMTEPKEIIGEFGE